MAIAEALKVNAVLTRLELQLDGNNIGDEAMKVAVPKFPQDMQL